MENKEKDQELLKLARKRANFRNHLTSYFITNAFLWVIWWLTSGRHGYHGGIPWPVWVMFGWGIGLAFNYFDAYGESKQKMIDREYEKLKEEREQRGK